VNYLSTDTLIEQLARAWGRMTGYPDGLTFCEPDLIEDPGCNIYARPMPIAKHRGDPCAALTLIPIADDPTTPTDEVLIRVEIRARQPVTAHLVAGDFAKVFWPWGGGRPTDITEPGQVVPGLLGVPAAITTGGGLAWRFIDIEKAAAVEPVRGAVGGSINGRTADGLAALAFAVRVTAIEHEVPAAGGEG